MINIRFYRGDSGLSRGQYPKVSIHSSEQSRLVRRHQPIFLATVLNRKSLPICYNKHYVYNEKNAWQIKPVKAKSEFTYQK